MMFYVVRGRGRTVHGFDPTSFGTTLRYTIYVRLLLLQWWSKEGPNERTNEQWPYTGCSSLQTTKSLSLTFRSRIQFLSESFHVLFYANNGVKVIAVFDSEDKLVYPYRFADTLNLKSFNLLLLPRSRRTANAWHRPLFEGHCDVMFMLLYDYVTL